MRKLPVGAEPAPAGGVYFRIWAPQSTRAEVVIGAEDSLKSPEELERQAQGCEPGICMAFDLTDVSNCCRIQPPGISLRDHSARR